MQTKIRMFYDKDTFQLTRVVIPTDDDELDQYHLPEGNEAYGDVTNDEYQANCLLNGLPDPATFVNYVLNRPTED